MRSVLFPAALSASLLLSGCYSVSHNVQATGDSPDSSQVAGVNIPYDPSLPRFVISVEPFSDGNEATVETVSNGSYHCRGGSCDATTVYSSRGTGVAAQLTSALSNVPNIAIADTAGAKNRSSIRNVKLNSGEVGPFIIRGTISEFTEAAEGSSRERHASLGWVGVVAGIAGAVSGNNALGWTGAGLAAANPTFQTAKAVKKGMVAFDVQVVDPRSNRVLKSFRAAGTFTSESALNGMSLFGIGGKNEEFAQSVVGQAMRAAMNNAVQNIYDTLKTAPRSRVTARSATAKSSAAKNPTANSSAVAPQKKAEPQEIREPEAPTANEPVRMHKTGLRAL